MEDDRSDAGSGGSGGGGAGGSEAEREPRATEPPSEPTVDPAIDQAARDEEFELFYRVEMPRLVGFLIVRGAEAALAADIAQETMVGAYQRWNDLDAPRGWVRTVAQRRWARLVGRQHVEEPAEQVPEPSGLLSPSEADVINQRHDVLAKLAGLSPAEREVMAFSFDGYQPNEIAGLLGKKAATVRSLLRQARATLREIEEATG